MGILRLLDELPDAITRSPAQLWSVLALGLGEPGANGRTGLARRSALTGTCPLTDHLDPARRTPAKP